MKSKILSSLNAVLLGLMLVFLLVFSDEATDAARNALHISSVSVIPSLFTYIVLCGVITKLDLLSPLGRLIPAEKLFGLPECTSPVILMGLVCGFPVGASCTADLYSVGAISKSDAERLSRLFRRVLVGRQEIRHRTVYLLGSDCALIRRFHKEARH